MSQDYHNTTGFDVRLAARKGELTSNTSGMAQGFVQANLVILPEKYSRDFLQFCQLNPKPCPLLAMSNKPGSHFVDSLGKDIDIRSDIPLYRIFESGIMVNETIDIKQYWRDDLVSFLLGCSFSFEEALIADGLEIRNLTEQKNVPMYNTSIQCQSAGIFSSNMVVSMRPMKPADAIRAIQICSRFPQVHGAPVHFGAPEDIGIKDINQPDYGDAVTIRDGEVPVFWACGVTPQQAIAQAKPDFCITHSPGCMLVTDIPNSKLAIL